MNKQKKLNLIVMLGDWIGLAVYCALFAMIATWGTLMFMAIILMAVGVFELVISIIFTVRHNKHKVELFSLIVAALDLLLFTSLITSYQSLMVNQRGNPYVLAIHFIMSTLLLINAVIKFIARIKIRNCWKSGEFKPKIKAPKVKEAKAEKERKEIKVKPFKEWFYVTHPKTLFFAGAGFLSMVSIFGMFGAVAKESAAGVSVSSPYNMFDAAFGLAKTWEMDPGRSIKMSAGVVFLLGFLALSIALAIFDFFRKKQLGKGFIAFNAFRAVLTLTILILAFSTLRLVSDPLFQNPSFTPYIKLGAGPVAIGVLNVIALVCYLAGFTFQIIDYVRGNKPAQVSANHAKPQPHKVSIFKQKPAKEVENTVSSEKSNIELLREYKKLLDEGVITKKEFEEKKKKLL